MQFGFEKYCCFIPHRLDTCFVFLWFFMTIGFFFITEVVNISAPNTLPDLAWDITWYSKMLIFVGALCGFGSSLFGSRKLTKVFSIILWLSCVASIIIYIMALYNLFLNSQVIIDTSKKFFELMRETMEESKRKNGLSENPLNHTDGQVSTDVELKLYDDEELEEMIKQVLKYFRIGYLLIALVIQLYQLYFANIVHIYSKKMLYFAQYHKLYAQKQEMLDKQDGKIE